MKPSFFVYYIILEKALQIINNLCTRYRNKSATLGNALYLIEEIIKTFECIQSQTT